MRLRSDLTEEEYGLLQRAIDHAGLTSDATFTARELRQLYRSLKQAAEKPGWLPIPRRFEPEPSQTWPRGCPEWFAAQQAHIAQLSDWVARGEITAVDLRTRTEVKSADIFTLLLTADLPKYLTKALLPMEIDPAASSLFHGRDGHQAAVASSLESPEEGSVEWSFKQTGRKPLEPWSEAHLQTLVKLKARHSWEALRKIYLAESASKLQARYYDFLKAKQPPSSTLENAWNQGNGTQKKA